MKYENEVDAKIQCMINNEIIERSNSSFLNPLVRKKYDTLLVVMKKDESKCLCLDMWELNNIIFREYDCEPRADKCERARSNFTKLDLKSSFW